METTGYVRFMMSALKLLRMVSHLLTGSITILMLFPHLESHERGHRVMRWSTRFLKALGVQLEVIGRPPSVRGGGILLAANHVSWLDIHLLHSLLPARFISKAEVRNWPLFGFLARASGTVFLVREKKSDAMRVNQIMVSHLRDGDCLALFPEGTTSDGSGLLPFYPSLFQPAVEAAAQVWPVRIRYLGADGSPCLDAAYFGGTTLGESVLKIVGLKGLRAQVIFLPPISSQGLGRRDLARATETAIRASFVVEGAMPAITTLTVDNAPENTVRLPAGRR